MISLRLFLIIFGLFLSHNQSIFGMLNNNNNNYFINETGPYECPCCNIFASYNSTTFKNHLVVMHKLSIENADAIIQRADQNTQPTRCTTISSPLNLENNVLSNKLQNNNTHAPLRNNPDGLFLNNFFNNMNKINQNHQPTVNSKIRKILPNILIFEKNLYDNNVSDNAPFILSEACSFISATQQEQSLVKESHQKKSKSKKNLSNNKTQLLHMIKKTDPFFLHQPNNHEILLSKFDNSHQIQAHAISSTEENKILIKPKRIKKPRHTPSLLSFALYKEVCRQQSNIDTIKRLLEQKANPSYMQHEETMLHKACDRKNPSHEVISLLLKHGCSLNGNSDGRNAHGGNALHKICSRNALNQEIFDLFLKNKVSWNAKDKNGETPLHHLYISTFGDPYSVPETNTLRPPKKIIINNNKPSLETFKLLLTKANVNIQNKNGDTILHLACKEKRRNHELIELLIAHGAKNSLKNKNGETPFSILFSTHEDTLNSDKKQLLKAFNNN